MTTLSTPIFLVGASRCGNTLLQVSLSRHRSIYISSETHWFDDERCLRDQPVTDDIDRQTVQDWFMALSDQPFGHSGDPENGWLDRVDLEQAACNANNNDMKFDARDRYFAAYCALDAKQHGKHRWGEKTPRHVFRINEILQAFPDAKIACSLRDPRAMVASYRQWSMRKTHDLYSDENDDDLLREQKRARSSYHPVIAALLWRSAVRASMKAQNENGHSHVKIILYEALVSEPRAVLEELAFWLDEDFDAAMLQVPIINSSFDEFQESAGFRPQAIDRWREHLDRTELAVIRMLCSREMNALGYPLSDLGRMVFWPVYVIPALVTLPAAVLRAWRANKDRAGNPIAYIWRRLTA